MSTHDDALVLLLPTEASVLIKHSIPKRRTPRETIPFYDAAYVSELRAQLAASEVSRKDLEKVIAGQREHIRTNSGRWADYESRRIAELEASRKKLREAQASAISAMKALRLTILNDGYAATFQTLGQYRHELIRRLTGIIDAALANDAEQKGDQQSTQAVKLYCPICKQPQFNSPSGMTCQNGHGGEIGIAADQPKDVESK